MSHPAVNSAISRRSQPSLTRQIQRFEKTIGAEDQQRSFDSICRKLRRFLNDTAR